LVAEPVGEPGAKPAHLPDEDVGEPRQGRKRTMRRLITLLSAMALMVGMLAIPATADVVDPELAELEAAVTEAQAEVDRWEGIVGTLEARLERAEDRLADAIDARDDLRIEVADLREEVALARQALLNAQVELDGLLVALASFEASGHYNTDNGDCNNRHGSGKAACEAARDAVLAGELKVGELEKELQQAEVDLASAERDLRVSEAEVILRRAHVASLRALLAAADYKLSQAEAELEAAEAARDAYEPAPGVEPAHPGCKGLENAKEQVAKNGNGKGKAAQVLDAVSEKHCA
jgi:hypothetical protein